MLLDTAKTSMTELADFFDRKLTEAKIRFYASDFRRVDDDIFKQAVAEACRVGKSFPTPRELREFVIGAERAEYAARNASSVSEVFTSRPADSECIKESRALLRRVGERKLLGADLVAEMKLMEKTFPGRGWGRQADEFAKDLAAMPTRVSNKLFESGDG